MVTLLPLGARSQAVIASFSIDQEPAPGFSVLGEWTLMQPNQKRVTSNNPSYISEEAVPGNYLLNIIPPSGMTAQVTQTLNGEQSLIDKPQVAFVLNQNDHATFRINYILKEFGKISVTSTPPGLRFTMSGPNDAAYEGTTPMFYDPMPVGLYSVTFTPIIGCVSPKPLSGRLTKENRVVLSITLACENLENLPQQQEANKTLQFVEASVDGVSLTFKDVPLNQWFSEPIHRSIEAGVMSGYRDRSGKPTGLFGPNDSVTLAELAKIAHKLAGIDEQSLNGTPENLKAKNTWFASYIASAEQRDWLVFLNRSVNPLRPATRAEVVATVMQALRVPRDWPTGVMFTDVSRTMPYADCIETAATKTLIAGYMNDHGQPTHVFGPIDPVNRAQMAKIISAAMDLFLVDSPSFQPE